jgi:hypothetical protein
MEATCVDHTCKPATVLPPGPPPAEPGGTGSNPNALSCCGYEWQFSTNVTQPPGPNSVRLNNTDKTLATAMYVTKSNSPNDNVASYLTSQAVVGRRLYMKELDDSDNNAIYTITGPLIDHGTYYEIPVSFVSSLPTNRVSLTILP